MIFVGGLRVTEISTEFSADAKRILGDPKRRFIRSWAVIEFNDQFMRVCSDTPINATAIQVLHLMGIPRNPKDMSHEDCAILFMWLQELKEDMVEAIKVSEIPSEALIKSLQAKKHEAMRQKRIRDVRNAQLNELSSIFIRFDFSLEEITELWKMAQVSKTMAS